jgi:acyl carrier protein
MDRELLTRVTQMAADQVGVLPSEITPASHFQNDLGFDSLDVAEFVMELEEEFEIRVEDADVEKLLTIGDVVTYLEKHPAKKGTTVKA